MRSSQEIADNLIEKIAHLYSKPGLYACTQSDLDGQLWQLHFVLGYVTEQEEFYRREHRNFCDPKTPSVPPDGYLDHIKSDADLKLVVRHWRAFDERVGLKVP